MRLKLSKFNYYREKGDGLLMYNTLSQQVVRITDKKMIDILGEISQKKNVEKNDNLRNLIKYKFVDNGTQTTANIHEIMDTELISEDKKLVITIIMSKQCNFRCSYCYEEHENKRFNTTSFNRLMKFIKNQSSSKEYIRVNFFGGEPTLEMNNVTRIMREINSFVEGKNLIVSYGMTTNGYLLNDENVKRLSDLGMNDLQVTLDGFKDVHNKNRHLPNGEGTYDTIMKNLDNIIENYTNLMIIVRTNFDKDSVRRQKRFLDFCNKRFKGRVLFHFESIKGWAENCADCMSNAEETKLISNLISYCTLNHIHTSYDSISCYGSLACMHSFKNAYVIDPDVKVMKCTVALNHEKNCIGIINADGELEANENMELWMDTNQSPHCSSCKVYPQCMKHQCPMNKIKNNKECDYEKIEDYLGNIVFAKYDLEEYENK